MLAILVILACYLIGGIPFGFLLGKANGKDIREHGSGNIGATNVWRVCGARWGLLCFALDAGKGFGPVVVCRSLASGLAADGRLDEQLVSLVAVGAVFATVAGHVFTPYLGFKGGKGVATSAGALAGLAGLPVLLGLLVWGIVFGATRWVSLASIAAAAALPVAGLALNAGLLPPDRRYDAPTLAVLAALAALTIFRHRTNIQRLLAGTEPRMGGKAKADANQCPQ